MVRPNSDPVIHSSLGAVERWLPIETVADFLGVLSVCTGNNDISDYPVETLHTELGEIAKTVLERAAAIPPDQDDTLGLRVRDLAAKTHIVLTHGNAAFYPEDRDSLVDTGFDFRQIDGLTEQSLWETQVEAVVPGIIDDFTAAGLAVPELGYSDLDPDSISSRTACHIDVRGEFCRQFYGPAEQPDNWDDLVEFWMKAPPTST